MAQESSGQAAEVAAPQRIVASKPGFYKVSYSTISSTGVPVSVRAPEWLPKVSVSRPLVDRWKAAREELKALGKEPSKPPSAPSAPSARNNAESLNDWNKMLRGRRAKQAEPVPAAGAQPAAATPEMSSVPLATETPAEAPPAEPAEKAADKAAAEAANAALAELRNQVESLRGKLAATEKERTRERNACNEAKEKVEFVQELYSKSSTAAANLAEKGRAAEEESARLRKQLEESVETLKQRYEGEVRIYAEKAQMLQHQVTFLQQQHTATDSSVREKAALWDAQQEREQEMQRERQRHWERMEARHPGEGIPISQLSGATGSAALRPAAPEPNSIADELAELAAEAAENTEIPSTSQRRTRRSRALPPASTPTAPPRTPPMPAETAKPPAETAEPPAEAPATSGANHAAPPEDTNPPAALPGPAPEQTTPSSQPTATSAAASLASSALKRLMPGNTSDDTPPNTSASTPNTPSRPRWKRRRRTADSGTIMATPPPTQ